MIKNYTSNSKQTFDQIQKCLAEHKANQVMFEYDDNGQVKTLNFALKIGDRFVGFRLPARVENVKKIFDNEGYNYKPEQPYKTAWANIRDWLTAQMALVDTDQVKLEEVFLPYAITKDNKTFFETIQENKYQLGSGQSNE